MLAAAVAALKEGRRLRVTPELQAQALAATEVPGGFKGVLSQDALVYAIRAEGLDLWERLQRAPRTLFESGIYQQYSGIWQLS